MMAPMASDSGKMSPHSHTVTSFFTRYWPSMIMVEMMMYGVQLMDLRYSLYVSISMCGRNMSTQPTVATMVMSKNGTHEEAIQNTNISTMTPST